MMHNIIATEGSARKGGAAGECFYCKAKHGTAHTDECVLVKRKVRLRFTIEYDADCPASWDAASIERFRNGSTFCMDNVLQDLDVLSTVEGCLCGIGLIECVELGNDIFEGV